MVTLVIVLVLLLGLAVLAPLYGVDSRPRGRDAFRADWPSLRHRS